MAARFADIGDTSDESQVKITIASLLSPTNIFTCICLISYYFSVFSYYQKLHLLRQYEQYTARRIPGKQAVVVMACDNTHISDDMILEPGIVMIFAHGIE